MAIFHLGWLLPVIFSIQVAQGAGVSDSEEVVTATTTQAIASQKRIDELATQTEALLLEYRRLLEGVEYEAAQRRELQSLQETQLQQIEKLELQIATAKATRQRIVPLMRSMVESLQVLVALDLPFHQEQRLAAVLALQQNLSRPDLPVSTRLRMLLEAYQVEQDYGNTIEAWRGTVERENETLSVEFLRLGRLALYYRLLDGSGSGYWDPAQAQWEPLNSEFNRPITRAMRVARNEGAPQLLLLPLTQQESDL